MQTGDIIDVTSFQFLDDDGTQDTVNFQVLSKIESQVGLVKIKALETKFDAKFDSVNSRFDSVNSRFDSLEKRMTFLTWFLPIFISLMIFGVNLLMKK